MRIRASFVAIVICALSLESYAQVGGKQQAVHIDPSNPTIQVGQSITLRLLDQSGQLMSGVKWSSSNTAVVTITSAGILTGRGTGTARIRGQIKGSRDETTVTVQIFSPVPAHPCDGSDVTILVGPMTIDGIEFCHSQRDSTGEFNPPAEAVVSIDGNVIFQGALSASSQPNAAGLFNFVVSRTITETAGDHPLRIQLRFVRFVFGLEISEWADTGSSLVWRVQ